MRKSLKRRVIEWYQNLKARLVLRVAIEKADMLNLQYGVRYWAIPTPEGSLMVLNWKEVQEYKELGILPQRLKVQQLYQLSFYWSRSRRRGNRGFQCSKKSVNMTRLMQWWYGTRKRREEK